jgi:hypothetical protein
MQLISNTKCSMLQKLIVHDSYLLAMSLVAEQMPHLTALLAACSTLALASYTFHSPLATATSSRSQYLAPCDGGVYYHPNS